MIDVNVTWTGEWPRKCRGRWIFEVDGKDYRYLLPFANDDGFDLPADTYGEHECWNMDDEGEREWLYLTTGLDIEDWIEQNREWLSVITPHERDWDDIFYAFQQADWRFQECGGCVSARLRKANSVYLDTFLPIDDILLPYCRSCESRNTMGINGVIYTFKFPNRFEALAMKSYGTYGWNMDLWEVDLYLDGELTYVNDFEYDVVGNLDNEGVNKLLAKVMNYPKED